LTGVFPLVEWCNKWHSTLVIPFRLTLQSGTPVHEQVAFAARKAMMSGKLRPGDPFPSVRALSRALHIHANTAQRVVSQLTQQGLLEVRPGIGTVVSQPPPSHRAERVRLLGPEIDQIVVESMRLGLSLGDLQAFIENCWQKLQPLSGVTVVPVKES
jgi:GntR family transcriptional regulator